MSRVLIGNLPPGTTIRNIDDFCSPYGRLLYVDVKNQGNSTLACVEYENLRNSLNLVRARHGYNFNGYNVQLKLMDDSGPCEVRDDTRQQNQLPAWSNNQMSNNGMQGPSSFNYGGNNLGGNTYNNDCGPSLDNSLDFNDACRVVYDRFLQEGYNRQVAKEKTLEFVSNMQRGPSQGFNNFNSNYFGSDQDMMNSNSNFDNFNNGNQNWSGGNNYDNGDQQMFSNSNWGGNFNGLSDQQMPSAWGGLTGYNDSGMSYPMGGGNFSGRSGRGAYRDDMPSSSRRNIGGSRKDIGTTNVKMGLNATYGVGIGHDDYLKSLESRKDIEDRIKQSGIKTESDSKNLNHLNKVISDYQLYNRQTRKSEKLEGENDEKKLTRYLGAKAVVSNFRNHTILSRMSDKKRKLYIAHKAIVDAYEQSISKKNNDSPPTAEYEARKKELLEQSKFKNGTLSGKSKILMRSLMLVGVDWNEAKQLALHPKIVVQDLIQLRNYPIKVDINEQLKLAAKAAKVSAEQSKIGLAYIAMSKEKNENVTYLRRKDELLNQSKLRFPAEIILSKAVRKNILLLTSAGVDEAEAKLLARNKTKRLQNLLKIKKIKRKVSKAEKKAAKVVKRAVNAKKKAEKAGGGQEKNASTSNNSKQLVPVIGAAEGPSYPAADTMANKIKAAYESANSILRKHTNCDLDKLTEKQKAIIRIALRRLRSHYTNEGKEIPISRFDVLLADDDENM